MTNNNLSWVVVVIVIVVVGVLFICQLIYVSQETVSDLTSAKGFFFLERSHIKKAVSSLKIKLREVNNK